MEGAVARGEAWVNGLEKRVFVALAGAGLAVSQHGHTITCSLLSTMHVGQIHFLVLLANKALSGGLVLKTAATGVAASLLASVAVVAGVDLAIGVAMVAGVALVMAAGEAAGGLLRASKTLPCLSCNPADGVL